MTKRRANDHLAPDPEMWAALEGGVLKAILDDFYTHVFADSRLAPFFDGVTQERVSTKQHAFMRQVFTGEKLYFGDRPHWMVISDELFDHREELMMEALRRHGLDEELVQRWRSVDECFRKQIVKSKAFGKKIRGVELPLEGYESLELTVGSMCDSCQEEMPPGVVATYHVRTGRTYCSQCKPGA